MRKDLLFTFAIAATLAAGLLSAKSQEAVDVALVLAVDVSLSMSAEELQIQREGYASAIGSSQVVNAIRQGGHGRIAVTMFEWAADSHAREVVGWTVIETQDDADRIAASLVDSMSYGQRRTSISGAIVHASDLLEKSPYAAQRRVIDISGDGPNNQGSPVVWARDEALRKGFTINGLPLMTRSGPGEAFNIRDLDVYYSRCVIGGPGSFMIPVNDWGQFAEAVRRKLVLEIGEMRTPGWPVVQAQFEQDAYDCLVGEKIWQQRLWQYEGPGR